MLNSAPIWTEDRPPSCLFLGAHCDDIEIGCGATVLKLTRSHPDARIRWVTFSSSDVREVESRRSAARFLSATAETEISVERFRNGYFPQVSGEIKDFFEYLKGHCSPDIIFTHYRDDLHQDHRIIAELTWNTFRNHLILEYEIPKFDGDLVSPNVFCPITQEELEEKSAIIIQEYRSQRDKQWFDHMSFQAIARLRGIESNSPNGLAEGFHCRKLPLRF